MLTPSSQHIYVVSTQHIYIYIITSVYKHGEPSICRAAVHGVLLQRDVCSLHSIIPLNRSDDMRGQGCMPRAAAVTWGLNLSIEQ